MITITFNCTTVTELREQMALFLNTSLPPQVQHVTIDTGALLEKRTEVVNEEPAPKPFDLEVMPKVQPKRTRRSKAEIEAARNGGVAQTETEDEAVALPTQNNETVSLGGAVTKENVHQALQQVNVAVGLPKSREILSSFGANRISEIKPEQFKAFVDKCNEAVMTN